RLRLRNSRGGPDRTARRLHRLARDRAAKILAAQLACVYLHGIPDTGGAGQDARPYVEGANGSAHRGRDQGRSDAGVDGEVALAENPRLVDDHRLAERGLGRDDDARKTRCKEVAPFDKDPEARALAHFDDGFVGWQGRPSDMLLSPPPR